MPSQDNRGGVPGDKPIPVTKEKYTPEMREKYREYYKAKSRERANAGVSVEKQKAADVRASAPRPRASENTPPRPATGSAQRPASYTQRPVSSAQRPAARAPESASAASRAAGTGASRPRTSGGGFRMPNRYVRMLLAATALVLLMFGIIKGVGALTKADEVDFIPPTLITPAPIVTPAPEITPPPENAPSDNGQQAETSAQSTDAPAVTSAPTPETDEGYFPEETDHAQATAEPTVAGGANVGRTARIRFAGDLVIHQNLMDKAHNSKTDKYDFSRFFGLIQDALSNADLTVANVDGPMGGKGNVGYKEYPMFNTPPTLMYALKNAGVDMISLANNHCLDTWFDGLKQTIVNCDYVGLEHFGAYASQTDFDTPEIFDVNGIKVGFLNYTQALNTMDSQKSLDPNALKFGLRRTSGANYESDVKKMREVGAEVVVVYMHWGKEYLRKPDDNQQYMAKQIANAGADIIVGGHPHYVQPAVYVKGTTSSGETNNCFTMFSIGNFLSDQRQQYRDSGIIFEFTLQENLTTGKIEVVAPKYLSTYVWRVGTEGDYDYRVVGVEATIANRPAGMSDSTYARLLEVRNEMSEVLNANLIEPIAK